MYTKALATLATLAALAGCGMSNEQLQSQQTAKYCEMVRLHHDTSGALGWPDYAGRFELDCNDKEG